MKRTPQEIVELVVFGLIALLLGTGVLWLAGSLLGLLGIILGWLAGLLWGILSFLVPVALVAGAGVLIVRWAQGRDLNPFAPIPAEAAMPREEPIREVERTSDHVEDSTEPDAPKT
jgi:hypothetical protein